MHLPGFDEIWETSSKVNGLYSKEEALLIFGCAGNLRPGSTCLEIGVLYGRTASILMQMQPFMGFKLWFVDPWVLNGSDARPSFKGLAQRLKANCCLVEKTSREAVDLIPMELDFVHVDGCHDGTEVRFEIDNYVSRVRPGGYVVFHDYGSEDYPGVQAEVDDWYDLNRLDGWVKVKQSGEAVAYKRVI